MAAAGRVFARDPRAAVEVAVWERGAPAPAPVLRARAVGVAAGEPNGLAVPPALLARALVQRRSGGGSDGGAGGILGGGGTGSGSGGSGSSNPFGFLLRQAKSAVRASTTHRAVVTVDVAREADAGALAALARGRPTASRGAALAEAAAEAEAEAEAPQTDQAAAKAQSQGQEQQRQRLEPQPRQQWVVSAVVEERSGLGGLARQLAGAGSSGSSSASGVSPMVAVAVCLEEAPAAGGGATGASSPSVEVVPAPGLHAMALSLPPAPLQLPRRAGAAGGAVAAAAAPGGSLLGAQGFAVAGEFGLGAAFAAAALGADDRAAPGASRRLPGVLGDDGAAAAAAAAAAADGAATSGDGGAPSLQQQHQQAAAAIDPRLEALLAGVVTAWEGALRWLAKRPGGPPGGLHRALPDLIGASAAGDAAAARVFAQMLRAAADRRAWPLHSGRLVHVREGAFLQPPGATATAAAAATALAAAPAPANAVAAIAAAVQSAAAGLRGGAAPPSGRAAATSAAAAAAASGPRDIGAAGLDFVKRHLPLLAVPWPAKLQLEAAGVTGLRVVSPASLRPLLRQLGRRPPAARGGGGIGGSSSGGGAGSAVGGGGSGSSWFEGMSVEAAVDLLAFCCGDLLEGAEGSGGPAAAAAAGTAAPPLPAASSAGRIPGFPSSPRGADATAAPATAPPARHPGRVRDLAGVPVPTADGAVAALGCRQLYVVPLSDDSGAGSTGSDHPIASGLLPPALGRDFVHPSAVAALAGHLMDPALRAELKLQLYGPAQLALHARALLGDAWCAPPAAATAARAARGWDAGAGGGPRPAWLRRLWRLARRLDGAAAEWGAPAAAADTTPGGRLAAALGPLLLVPLADGRLAAASLLPAVLVADGGDAADDDDDGSGGGAAGEEEDAASTPEDRPDWVSCVWMGRLMWKGVWVVHHLPPLPGWQHKKHQQHTQNTTQHTTCKRAVGAA